jgi:hypothetical protein
MVAILNDAVAQTSQAGIERTENLIEGTESPLRFLAEVAGADPGYFAPSKAAICCTARSPRPRISTPSTSASRMAIIGW